MALAGLLLAAGVGRSEGGGPYDPAQNTDRLISQVLADARRQRKRVLVEVGSDQCRWVRKLDALMDDDKEISGMLDRGYVHLRLPIQSASENQWVRSHLPELNETPSLFVLERDGGLLHRQDSVPLESGDGYDRGKVLGFLGEWASQESAEAGGELVEGIPEIEDAASPEVAAAELPVVVYYRSSRSPAEPKLTAILEEIAADAFGKAQFFAVDADKPKRAGRPSADAAAGPSLLLLKDGKRRKVSLSAGGGSAKELKAQIESWLSR